MPLSFRYALAKWWADSLRSMTELTFKVTTRIEDAIHRLHASVENGVHKASINADETAVAVAQAAHDKIIAGQHAVMREAHAMVEAAERARDAIVHEAANVCDNTRVALRKARDWHLD